MVTRESVQQNVRVRVSAGARLLDQEFPMWRKRVDSTMDIRSHDFCVLAQVYGSFLAGLRVLHIQGDGTSFGFNMEPRYRCYGLNNLEHEELQKAWDVACKGGEPR